ncbi:MAG: 16S rRNA (uracil(1498)-N(3))-methyltransferase [Polaromonas sp.]
MTARFYADMALAPGALVSLPDAVARHVQVLRLQPGGHITLFNGQPHAGHPEGAFDAVVERMGRSDVDVTVGAFTPTARETRRAVHLAVGMPANDRMDWLVEKATELGVASIQPLMTERSVLRLKAERADKKLAHWRGVAVAACEQSGRNRVPVIHEVMTLAEWLSGLSAEGNATRLLLSLASLGGGTQPLPAAVPATGPLTFLSGPEGGLGPQEETAARAAGFAPVTLGPRVLRSETAPLACLAYLSLTD